MKALKIFLFLTFLCLFGYLALVAYVFLKKNGVKLEDFLSGFDGENNQEKEKNEKLPKKKNELKDKKNDELTDRQKEIVEFLEKFGGESVKMNLLSKNFNTVTPRTLRRDLQNLVDLGIVKSLGTTKDREYKLIG
ncbi:MAG: hypothetical protein KatS3mg085_329 [Candidatus Dojkabacteria bacterium]|nr:MAG: hypothetical protein KatS3mg085_329 [Candidatus Dojkabacteria bacterium]